MRALASFYAFLSLSRRCTFKTRSCFYPRERFTLEPSETLFCFEGAEQATSIVLHQAGPVNQSGRAIPSLAEKHTAFWPVSVTQYIESSDHKTRLTSDLLSQKGGRDDS